MGACMFVHLRCHSHYSFLRGVNPPEEIIAAAVEQKMPAVALTDTDGMYAAVPFYQAARAAGVKAIVGVSAFAEATADGEKRKVEVKEVKEKAGARMLLLAMDARGYSNLCQLTTLRHLGVLRAGQETFAEDAGRAVTMEELAEHSAGVIALWPAREFLRRGIDRLGLLNGREQFQKAFPQGLKPINGTGLMSELKLRPPVNSKFDRYMKSTDPSRAYKSAYATDRGPLSQVTLDG